MGKTFKDMRITREERTLSAQEMRNIKREDRELRNQRKHRETEQDETKTYHEPRQS